MNILIIGGTQGVGRALAQRYLAENHHVCVCGRDTTKLKTWQYSDHPLLSYFALDINNNRQLSDLFNQYTDKNLDLLINCAGVYVNNRQQSLCDQDSLVLLNTNVLALNNILSLASELMLKQRTGHIVALSSVAALINYSSASLYSASKRSVLSLCDTYRTALLPFGIQVTAIVPGYINTAQLRHLNAGDASHKLFIIQEDTAAQLITNAIASKQAQFVFPKRMHWLMRVLGLVPQKLLNLVL